MLEEKWLNQRVGTVYTYWETRVAPEHLFDKCVKRTMEMIRQYREGEDPEQYRAYIEQRVRRLMGEQEG